MDLTVNPSAASAGPDAAQITVAKLRRLVPGLEDATLHACALDRARDAAELTTPERVRQFLAQVAHETGGFNTLVENLRYRDAARLDKLFSRVNGLTHARQLIAGGPVAIANCVYANRNGNGGPASGDGWRYRGRGYLQITGRGNYRQIGRLIGMDLEERPEQLEDHDAAAAAAALYWRHHRINEAADVGDVLTVTRRINPALAGLDDRGAWLGRARKVWP